MFGQYRVPFGHYWISEHAMPTLPRQCFSVGKFIDLEINIAKNLNQWRLR